MDVGEAGRQRRQTDPDHVRGAEVGKHVTLGELGGEGARAFVDEGDVAAAEGRVSR